MCMYILQVMAEMHVAFSLLREALLSRRDSQQHDALLTTDAFTSNSNSSSTSSSDSAAANAVTVVKMDPPQLLHTSDNTVVLTWPPAQLLAQVSRHLANTMYECSHIASDCKQTSLCCDGAAASWLLCTSLHAICQYVAVSVHACMLTQSLCTLVLMYHELCAVCNQHVTIELHQMTLLNLNRRLYIVVACLRSAMVLLLPVALNPLLMSSWQTITAALLRSQQLAIQLQQQQLQQHLRTRHMRYK
jgi:hypothetical protein